MMGSAKARRSRNVTIAAGFVAVMALAWGCTTGTGPAAVIVPDAHVSALPTSGCEPLTVQFSSLDTIDPEWMEYHWDFGDGHTSTERHPLHTYETAGTYIATLLVTEMHGLLDSDTVIISVSDSAECGGVVVECVKYEGEGLTNTPHGTVLSDANGQYVWLSAPPVGSEYTMLIVKAGSEVSVSDGDPTEVYDDPTPGVKYYADDFKDVSYWTICLTDT